MSVQIIYSIEFLKALKRVKCHSTVKSNQLVGIIEFEL